MRVFVLGSGSSGNALLVESRGTRVLVDAGVGPTAAAARLARLGSTLEAGELDGIVATHHHGDHFAQVARLARVFGAPVHLHGGIDTRRVGQRFETRTYRIGRPFRIGALVIETVLVPHDAPHVAVRIDDGDLALGVATDIGRVTPGLVGLLGACDAALVEANHCSEMLAYGPYPDHLKRRVAGGLGHLSNAQTAELASRLVGSRLGRIWLGHLSRENNDPARARDVVASSARKLAVEVLPHGAVCALDVRRAKPVQLALAF